MQFTHHFDTPASKVHAYSTDVLLSSRTMSDPCGTPLSFRPSPTPRPTCATTCATHAYQHLTFIHLTVSSSSTSTSSNVRALQAWTNEYSEIGVSSSWPPVTQAHVCDHLQREARGTDVLVLWLDCDREGENICFEVMDNVLPHMARRGSAGGQQVLRARFSAITAPEIRAAMVGAWGLG